MSKNDLRFSDFIVYVDESGDHGLESIDPEYPIFVLSFCVFKKIDYTEQVSTAIQRFKFKHFGHDMVVLHEHAIRKAKGEFILLIDKEKRTEFIEDLTSIIHESSFTVISTVIKKNELAQKYSFPNNPYHIALKFGLERIFSFLKEQEQHVNKTHIIFESRGKKEDAELELEFRRVCDGDNFCGVLPFEIIIADKKSNSCGLQLADLVARPIGRYILNPKQENRAYAIIDKKFYRNRKGNKVGWGLKCFP